MSVPNLKEKIEKIYKGETSDKRCQNPAIPVKNIELLITHMIKQHYEWEEIKAIITILKKGKGEDLVNIVNNTIN